ncbi:MAG: 16S rRNA (guanine(527)-N(7))-methyltransferase RsmG [Gammaproteobacteria bacterium]|nr:16S rRNA (guanine(527)-N(7))-methyltransferase RsmG [Gammaproteobacteria bacterium]
MNDLSDSLLSYINGLGLELSEDKRSLLLRYLDLLFKWNKAYNLTAIKDRQTMLVRHIVESLALIPYIYGREIADIGTGAGLPGIPLAIAFPDRHFTLVDSNGKKTRFLNQVKLELSLKNITVMNNRIETLRCESPFDQILSRAFADIATTLELLDHVWPPSACLSLMKGPGVAAELSEVGVPISHKIIELNIPSQKEYRCIVEIKRN